MTDVALRTRSLLVTGGAGFLGANFVHHWVAQHPADQVVVFDALTYAGRRVSLQSLERDGRVQFVHGDICDANDVRAVIAAYHVDTVVHFAAESHVDRSIAAPDVFVRTNVLGTHAVLEAVRVMWCRGGRWRDGVRFHHVSTDEVYGPLATTAAPFTEQAPYNPSSPYAASKAGSDHLVRASGRTYGLPYTMSHCANNYGPRQFPEKLIPFMLRQLLDGRALPLYGDGQQRREWLHVHDHCALLERILLADLTAECFNIGGGEERSNIEVVTQLCAVLDERFARDASLTKRFPDCPAARGDACATLIAYTADRPGHDRRYALDGSKLFRMLGGRPTIDFESGLAATVDWYLSNEAWWRAVV